MSTMLSARVPTLPGARGVMAVHPSIPRVEATVALVASEAATIPGDIGRRGAIGAILTDLTPVATHLAPVVARLTAVVTNLGACCACLRAGRRGGGRGGGRGLSATDGRKAEG